MPCYVCASTPSGQRFDWFVPGGSASPSCPLERPCGPAEAPVFGAHGQPFRELKKAAQWSVRPGSDNGPRGGPTLSAGQCLGPARGRSARGAAPAPPHPPHASFYAAGRWSAPPLAPLGSRPWKSSDLASYLRDQCWRSRDEPVKLVLGDGGRSTIQERLLVFPSF